MDTTKFGIVIALVIVTALVISLSRGQARDEDQPPAVETKISEHKSGEAELKRDTMPDLVQANLGKPLLIDIGAEKCIPCVKMEPILADLKENYSDRFGVEFINVRKNFKAGEEYGIQLIPTQIFYDASGKELYRHEGFFSKEGILAKWKELGYDFGEPEKGKQG